MFRHYHRHPRFRGHASNGSYTSKQIAALYNYPAGATGKGTKVAIISLGGDFSQADCDAYSKLLGQAPSTVTAHLIAGATRVSDPGGADVENMLDLCCVGGSAPGAARHIFFAPNTDAGFAAAIQAAVDADCDVISISWGAPENQWTTSAIVAMNAAFSAARAKGIVITVASGDNGSTDGEAGSSSHVDFPASSIYAVGCGGTGIKSTSPLSEVVWSDGSAGGATGGGVSADFALPTFQAASGVPGGGKKRGVPDCALNADPESGYLIIANGQQEVVGGTSGAAPMCAGLVACLIEKLGKRFDFQAAVYQFRGSALSDITSGNNGVYIARAGWDACTGNGRPDGGKLLAALSAPVVTPPVPTPVPTPTPTPTPSPAAHTLTFVGATSVLYDGKALP